MFCNLLCLNPFFSIGKAILYVQTAYELGANKKDRTTSDIATKKLYKALSQFASTVKNILEMEQSPPFSSPAQKRAHL